MRDVYLILRQKESDLDRLRVEIDSLRLVAPLLADDDIVKDINGESSEPAEPFEDPQSTGTDGPLPSTADSETRFWGLMKGSRKK